MALPTFPKMPGAGAGGVFKGMAGEANALASALDAVNGKLAKFERATKLEAIAAAKDPVKKRKLELELERDTLAKKAGNLALEKSQRDQARTAELGALKKLGDERATKAKNQRAELLATAGHLKTVAGAYLLVGAAAGRAALEGGKLAGEALAFKQDTTFALKFMLGSGQAAERTFGTMANIANTLGISSAEAMEQFQKISQAGVRQGEAQQLVQLAQDIKKATGADVSGQLGQALMGLKKNQAPLNVASFDVLKDAGLSETRINDILAKRLKVTETDDNKRAFKVQQALAQQQLRGQKAIDFWGEIMLAATGKEKAGQLAQEKQNTTLTGSLDKIQAKWTALWGAVNSTPAGQKLVAILQGVAAAIDPSTDSGKKLVATLDRAAAMAEKLFGKVSADDVLAVFDAVESAVGDVFDALEPLSGGLFDGLKSGFDAVKQVMAVFDDGSQGPQDTAAAWRAVGEAIGFVAVMVGAGVGALLYLNSKVLGFVAFLQGTGGSIGVFFVDGIIGGFESAKGRLVERVGALASLLPSTVRKLLKIESPSKVMAQLGAYTAEGMAVGLDRGAPDVETSAKAALVPTVEASAKTARVPTVEAPQTLPPRAAAPAITLPPITMIFNGVPAGDAEAIKRQVEQALEEMMARILLQLGGQPA